MITKILVKLMWKLLWKMTQKFPDLGEDIANKAIKTLSESKGILRILKNRYGETLQGEPVSINFDIEDIWKEREIYGWFNNYKNTQNYVTTKLTRAMDKLGFDKKDVKNILDVTFEEQKQITENEMFTNIKNKLNFIKDLDFTVNEQVFNGPKGGFNENPYLKVNLKLEDVAYDRNLMRTYDGALDGQLFKLGLDSEDIIKVEEGKSIGRDKYDDLVKKLYAKEKFNQWEQKFYDSDVENPDGSLMTDAQKDAIIQSRWAKISEIDYSKGGNIWAI